jgi:hypothetical protein
MMSDCTPAQAWPAAESLAARTRSCVVATHIKIRQRRRACFCIARVSVSSRQLKPCSSVCDVLRSTRFQLRRLKAEGCVQGGACGCCRKLTEGSFSCRHQFWSNGLRSGNSSSNTAELALVPLELESRGVVNTYQLVKSWRFACVNSTHQY